MGQTQIMTTTSPQAPAPALAPQGGGELFSPDRAVWNQRLVLAQDRSFILRLVEAIGENTDMLPYQWFQLMSAALEFKPDLILELGRGEGNSTCAYTEAAHLMVPHSCQVVSVCWSRDWGEKSVPRLRQMVPDSWAQPLKAFFADILSFDFPQLLASANRVLVFWDAHGYDVAECVLGTILPVIQDRPHLVLMHDLSDARYMPRLPYGDKGLWRGNDWQGDRLQLGHINSCVEQAVSITDFCSRNSVELNSADQSLREAFDDDQERSQEMRSLWGPQIFQTQAHWFWFSLNRHKGPFTFPRFDLEAIRQRKQREQAPQELEEARRVIAEQQHTIEQLKQMLGQAGLAKGQPNWS